MERPEGSRAVDLTQSRSASVFSGGVAGIPPQMGSDETLARPQGKAFPSPSTRLYLDGKRRLGHRLPRLRHLEGARWLRP